MPVTSGDMRLVVAITDSARLAIRERRMECGLSQERASDGGGLSLATWQGVEVGRIQSVRLSTAQAMARALGWTPDSIERLARGEEPVEAATERPQAYASTADAGPLSERELAIVKSAVTEALAQIKREQGGQP